MISETVAASAFHHRTDELWTKKEIVSSWSHTHLPGAASRSPYATSRLSNALFTNSHFLNGQNGQGYTVDISHQLLAVDMTLRGQVRRRMRHTSSQYHRPVEHNTANVGGGQDRGIK